MGVTQSTPVPINVVGSSVFGIWPKISVERTYNMFMSDDWMIATPGFQKVLDFINAGEGRGLFLSIRNNYAIAVISSAVYKILPSFAVVPLGTLDSSSGEVSIDENLAYQIAICDGHDVYIYNEENGVITKQALTWTDPIAGVTPIVPGYVVYHNTFFLIASNSTSIKPQNWYAFEPSGVDNDHIVVNTVFSIQTKPDNAVAISRLPGRGNNIIVFGTSVAEVWTQVGGIDNYKRVQSYNIDLGCASPSTVASSDTYVCWLGINENNSPGIVVTDGGNTRRISTDGIDNLLKTIKRPDISTAQFYQQDGHLFYVLTFFDEQDNLTIFYDFDNDKFYDQTDEANNYFPARQSIYFNEKLLFVSINDAALYDYGTQYISYNYSLDTSEMGELIPRIRNCKSVRKQDSSRFRAQQFTFWIEQGVNNFYLTSPDDEICDGLLITEIQGDPIVTEDGLYTLLAEDGECVENNNRPRVDMAFSKNGNQSFSNYVARFLNPSGVYRNQIRWNRMAQANEFTIQLRFYGFQRFVVQNGILDIMEH